MKLKYIILSTLIGVAFFDCQQSRTVGKVHSPNAELLLPKIVKAVQDRHFKPRLVNDEFSQDMFAYFIEQLDPQKEFLTQKDIVYLSKYKLTLDEAIKDNNFEFFNTAVSLLENGIAKAEKYSTQVLNDSPDFSKKEQLEINFSKLTYASDDKALKKRWQKKLKKYLLDQMYVEELNDASLNEKNLLANAKEKVGKLLAIKFEKLKSSKDNKHIETYANAFLKVNDYQSQYFSPKEKSAWEENFTRSFVGIGVRLETENAYPKIAETIIGGPAWKSNLLQTHDEILKIREQDKSSVDLMGKSIDEIVSLLKGERGTNVYLTIKNKDAQIKEVKLLRDKIEFDLAMSFLLETNQAKEKIGYIRLPRFYAGDPGSAAHVLAEIETLKANKVDGIIFDVRNNHGGSAGQCRDIIGYFLKDGIYMQTKRSKGDVNQISNDDPSVQYDGKLLVLTNSRSGSASELLSGTLQDYKRALIVGSESTYGKGSMQNFVDLNESENTNPKLGEIKMSVGLFYTASGRSPQSTGIVPDIKLTDDSKYVPSGERAETFSMANDALPKTMVSQNINVVENIEQLRSNSELRISKNKKFQLADKKAKRVLALQESNLIDLDIASYKKQKEHQVSLEKEWKEIFSDNKDFKVSFDKTQFAQDSVSIINRERWINQIKCDPYIYECYQIMNDMLG